MTKDRTDRQKKIDDLADALERMWIGGSDYGVYTVAREREKVRTLLHELLRHKEKQG